MSNIPKGPPGKSQLGGQLAGQFGGHLGGQPDGPLAGPPAGCPPTPSGDVQVQDLLCKSCGLCAEYCPRGLMRAATDVPAEQRTSPVMNPAGHVVYAIHDPAGQCTGCGICGQMCPEGAIVVYRRKKKPTPGAGPK